MLSSPGDAVSVMSDGIFLIRTMGLWGDVTISNSVSVGSAYLRSASTSLHIMAKGLFFLPYQSLISCSMSRLQQMCIPPHPLTTPMQPSSNLSARYPIGSSVSIPFPSLSTRRYDGPQRGQQIVRRWHLLPEG